MSHKRAKQTLFEKEHTTHTPSKPKQRSNDNVPRDLISHFAAKAFIAARSELKVAEEAESPTNVTVVSSSTEEVVVQPTTKMTGGKKERNRKICTIETVPIKLELEGSAHDIQITVHPFVTLKDVPIK